MAQRQPKVSVDRLSNLPEELICHILSFLPTLEAVKTTILSPKFLNLWKKITTISLFHQSEYPETKFRKFIKSVLKVLSDLETTCIDEFSIKLYYNYCIYTTTIKRRLSRCVRTAVAKHVKKLVIVNGYDYMALSFELPSCIFTSNSLEVLEVRNAILEMNPPVFSLPNLRILRWERVSLEGDVSFDRLISGCSSLHSLYLRVDTMEGYDNFEVWPPTLEHLTIILKPPYMRNEIFDYRLKIDAPALKYLHLEQIMFTEMSIRTSSSLIEAEISICNAYCDLQTIDNFIGALSNVKILVLDVYDNPLDGDSIVWPMFPNLTSLTLRISSVQFDIVKDLLQKLPRMETLDLNCNYSDDWNSLEEYDIPIGQLEMMEYIQLNASLWKKVKIMTQRKSRGEVGRLKKYRPFLSLRPKSSLIEMILQGT